MTSSVDPTLELEAIVARLQTLTGVTYEGIEQGTKLELDLVGNKAPYRDVQPGSTIPAGGGRLLGAAEQAQPQIWAFQISHYAPTRKQAFALAVESDKSLIGWAPSENAGPIGMFFFQTYDNLAKNGERIGTITTHFYQTELGITPDFSL